VAQIFPRWTNRLPLALGLGVPLVLFGLVGSAWYWLSPAYTDVGHQPRQPLPFSHRQHAGGLGLDCRYCHSTVELSSFAAVPPTETCLTCHGQVRKKAPAILRLRREAAADRSIAWSRVHLLPDHAYFDHRVHLAGGVGCAECHGRVDRMDTVYQAETLSMGWCLDCHRHPRARLRPVAEVTRMDYSGLRGPDPGLRRRLQPPRHCSGCHR
jgi:hypothetical protein